MENKQFWKVLYEHLERAATYAGKSWILNIIMTVTQLIVNDMTAFLCAPNLYVMGEFRTRALAVLDMTLVVNREAWEKTVSPPVLNTKKYIEKAPALQEVFAGCRKPCRSFFRA